MYYVPLIKKILVLDTSDTEFLRAYKEDLAFEEMKKL